MDEIGAVIYFRKRFSLLVETISKRSWEMCASIEQIKSVEHRNISIFIFMNYWPQNGNFVD